MSEPRYETHRFHELEGWKPRKARFQGNLFGKSPFSIPDYLKPDEPKPGRCWLCGGPEHGNEPFYKVILDCPWCLREIELWFQPYCPAGVSMGVGKHCPKCNEAIFAVVYWNGDVTIMKPHYKCWECGLETNSRDEMLANHYLAESGGWRHRS